MYEAAVREVAATDRLHVHTPLHRQRHLRRASTRPPQMTRGLTPCRTQPVDEVVVGRYWH